MTVVVVLAGHPDPAARATGWNLAVLVTAGVSAAGAPAVAACRDATRDGPGAALLIAAPAADQCRAAARGGRSPCSL